MRSARAEEEQGVSTTERRQEVKASVPTSEREVSRITVGRLGIRPLRQTMKGVAGLLAMPYRQARPRQLDEGFLARLQDEGFPFGSVTVTLQRLDQQMRRVPAFAVAEGVRSPRTFESALTSYVIRHPSATVLVDPALCADAEHRAVAELPWMLRTAVRPAAGAVPTVEAAERAGIALDEIDLALVTHLHWDHVCGLLDLPGLPLTVHGIEHDWILHGRHAPAGGVRAALQGRRIDRFSLDGPAVLTFERSHDLFGDGSVVLVGLPGHTPGSIGVLLRTVDGSVLLAGDAAWHEIQIDRLRQKAPFPGLIVDADRAEAFRTLHRLHAVKNRVRIIPAHDPGICRRSLLT
jgi:glyoxylase-like metal-dependent hydrolase (beta-lactamase superfamily II)